MDADLQTGRTSPRTPGGTRAQKPKERASLLDAFTEVQQTLTVDEIFGRFKREEFSSGHWVFRGQSNARDGLQPSIERLNRSHQSNLFAKEEYVRTEFKRKARHYVRDPPEEDDEMGWLALMRHHGAPSRLLDWTRSPYVAAFFAAFEARTGAPFAVWAVNQKELKQHARTILSKPDALQLLKDRNPESDPQIDLKSWEAFISSGKNFKATFLGRSKEPLFLVAPVEPFRTNERMTIQQGMFLCATTLAFPFERTLSSMLGDANAGKGWLYKFEIAPTVRMELLTELDKMNITEATLFPGLDGFARSLRISAEIPGRAPSGMEKRLNASYHPRENH